jgi:hypothetical protein
LGSPGCAGCLKMLESRLDKFKSGYKTCDNLVRDYVKSCRGQQFSESKGTHMTRIAAMDETNFWEGLGYMAGVIVNGLKHPRITYRLIVPKDKS